MGRKKNKLKKALKKHYEDIERSMNKNTIVNHTDLNFTKEKENMEKTNKLLYTCIDIDHMFKDFFKDTAYPIAEYISVNKIENFILKNIVKKQ